MHQAIQPHRQRVGPGDVFEMRHRGTALCMGRVDAGLQQLRRQAGVELDPVGTGFDLGADGATHIVGRGDGRGQPGHLGIVEHRAGIETFGPGERARGAPRLVARRSREIAGGVADRGDAETDQARGVVLGDGVVGQCFHDDRIAVLAHDQRPERQMGMHVDQAGHEIAARQRHHLGVAPARAGARTGDRGDAAVLDPHAARRAAPPALDIDHANAVERERARRGLRGQHGHASQQPGEGPWNERMHRQLLGWVYPVQSSGVAHFLRRPGIAMPV